MQFKSCSMYPRTIVYEKRIPALPSCLFKISSTYLRADREPFSMTYNFVRQSLDIPSYTFIDTQQNVHVL